jgi:hypothetical protein
VSQTMVGSAGTERVDVGQAGWCWRTHGALLRGARLLAPPERTAANYRIWSSQYFLHGRKNSFGKAHVLPCVPSLIQLQEPYTGRIMSRRRATSGKCGTTYSISTVCAYQPAALNPGR